MERAPAPDDRDERPDPESKLHAESLASLEDCLRLINDMARFVAIMALQDYRLFVQAPVRAEQMITTLKARLDPERREL